LCPCEIVRRGSYQKRKNMRTHVPAVGQQRHRVRRQPNRDLDNHHRGSNTNHNTRAPFRMRKIGNKVVSLTKTRMICPMHLIQANSIIGTGALNPYDQSRLVRGRPGLGALKQFRAALN
jgi:hypothetical protein